MSDKPRKRKTELEALARGEVLECRITDEVSAEMLAGLGHEVHPVHGSIYSKYNSWLASKKME